MGKVKNLWQSLSLRKSIVCYITVFALLAFLLSAVTAVFCNAEKDRISASYSSSKEKFYLTNENGERLGNGNYIGTEPVSFSEADERKMAALDFILLAATPLYSALCILAAAMLFYRNKLKQPLSLLASASDKISRNDLDFSIQYESNDELGRLCASFETMRQALAENFSVMWRQMEERKQLNAAFAHDLRTPLTVLKGYNEMLQTTDNQQDRDTALTMQKHISRMERYVDSMSHLQRLEDTEPEYQEVRLQEFITSLSAEAKLVCTQADKKLDFENATTTMTLFVDSEMISQVFNNLISNAVRFANTHIKVTCAETTGGLLLSVSDDGQGFSPKALHNAASPYFTEETSHAEHFGLGLYICKILCERHGGYLKVENHAAGAKVAAFFESR
ncbi:MAG: HAMP domain-containing sensor histidine kinase [Oscillospiraceae bacterium]|nr:HAMP domain-containing sensor histidine kinase [Oscillospiraceae bacterium]